MNHQEPQHFADRVIEACRRKHSCLVVGLDPHWQHLPRSYKEKGDPETAISSFLQDIVSVCAPFAAAFKPQIAFFERWGLAGMSALAKVLAAVRQTGTPIIMDAKRNDIGSTAQAYAQAFFAAGADFASDALTVNAYLGEDGIQPFLAERQHGLFVLVKTSNPSGGRFQDLALDNGRSLADAMAEAVEEWNRTTVGQSGYGNVGAVVGATYAEVIPRFRQAMPRSLLLLPGFGRQQQGRSLDLRPAFDSEGYGALVNSSRDILFPPGVAWDLKAVAAAAQRARDAINSQRQGPS